jgi:Pvc16 N-terminal domain
MSNALAIATVTATLQQTIAGALSGSGVAGAIVTALRLDHPALPTVGVNLFLYQVTPNLAFQNADLPTRRADGSLLRRPQAAIDLHYLVTFYGDDATLDQQRLLGATILELHASPVLTRDVVRQVQNSVDFLNGSNLADQIDVVRVTPANLSLEDMNRLWMTFPKVDYVLSVAYQAGPVLIESDDQPPAPALPVRKRRVLAVPFSLATIESVEPEPVSLWSGSAPTQIALIGSNLDPNDAVTFTTPGVSASLPGTVVSGTGGQQLVVALPAGLRPGVNTVQLTQFAASPSSGSAPPRPIAQSNAAAFVLRPTIVSLALGPPSGQLTVGVQPAVGPQQQVLLLLNQMGSAAPQAFVVPAADRTAPTETLAFDVSGIPTGSIPPELFGGQGGSIPPGAYLARVRVDGAESLLTVDSSGRYNGPIVTLS